tara:strand:- start:22670 stop:23236 length:567 start_codon:yes stop_codon:yes gene_type:complete
LLSAARHFAAHGLDGANINEISVGAGLARGTVYNYFDSKLDLFLAVIEDACLRVARRYKDREANAHSAVDLRSKLLQLLQADLEVLREEEDFARVFVREALSFKPETFAVIQKSLSPVLEPLIGILKSGQKSGEIRTDLSVEMLAQIFLGTASLFYVQHWGSEGAWPELESIPALVCEYYLQGVGLKA